MAACGGRVSRPLAEARCSGQLRPAVLSTSGPFPEPWFWKAEDGTICALNGLSGNAALYASPGELPRFIPDRLQPVLLAFQRLLGKQDLREENLRRLLRKTGARGAQGSAAGRLPGGPTGPAAVVTPRFTSAYSFAPAARSRSRSSTTASPKNPGPVPARSRLPFPVQPSSHRDRAGA